MTSGASEADLAGIERLREQYIGAVRSGDAERWLSTLTDDCVFLPPGEPMICGRDALRPWVTKAYFDAYDIEIDYRNVEVEVAGSWGYVLGTFEQTLTAKAGGRAVRLVGKYLDVVRRQPDGSWKLARMAFSADHP